MLVDIETFLLYSLVNTYTYRLINHLEDNVSNYDVVMMLTTVATT